MPRTATPCKRLSRTLPTWGICYQRGGFALEGDGDVNTSNSILTSSFTFTVPPAMLTGVMPKSVCRRDADPL
jgi:hypothetical protein